MSKRVVLKSIVAVAVAGFVLMFSSCKKPNDEQKEIPQEEPKEEPSAIVGVWIYEKIELYKLTCEDPSDELLIKAFIQMGLLNEFASKIAYETVEFTQDGEVIYNANTNDTDSYTTANNKLTITKNGKSSTYDYSIANNKLYWDIDILKMVDEHAEFAPYKSYLAVYSVIEGVIRVTYTK